MTSRRNHMDLSGFGGSDAFKQEEDVDPMSNIANLVDTMLVFACGLLIALVTYWNLELPDVSKVVQQQQMTEIEDINVQEDELIADGSSYTEKGMVYEDEDGQMWLLEESGSRS